MTAVALLPHIPSSAHADSLPVSPQVYFHHTATLPTLAAPDFLVLAEFLYTSEEPSFIVVGPTNPVLAVC